jgi:hypothetical protein
MNRATTKDSTPIGLCSFDRPTNESAHIRGSLFTTMPAFVKNRFGAERFPEFLSHLRPEVARIFSTEFQALAWYPFFVVSSAVSAMAQMSGPLEADKTLELMARDNLDRATNLIFRAIFKLGSPEFMLSKSDQVWKRYYSKGYMKAVRADEQGGVVQLFDFPEITPHYNRVVLHAIAATIVKAGGHLTRAEITRDSLRGDAYCEYSYAWSRA